MNDTEQTLSGKEFLLVLAGLLEPRRLCLGATTVAFTIVEDGCFWLDTTTSPLVHDGLKEDAQTFVISNRRTLEDMLLGRFDPSAPKSGQLFLWSGEARGLNTIAAALEGGASAFDAHLSALKGR